MKTYNLLLLGFSFMCSTISSQAQGSFRNLNFEAAKVPNGTQPGSLIPIGEGLLAWSGYFISGSETVQETQVTYEGISLGGPVISIVDANVGFGFNPIQGNYSAFLFGGGSRPLYSAEISQTGVVPSGTRSLLVDVRSDSTPFTVTLGGQTINMVPLQMFSTYTLYGGDVSSFAGQVAALNFIAPPASGAQPSMLELDNMVFSPNSVPEPTTLGLLACGGLLFVLRRTRSCQQQRPPSRAASNKHDKRGRPYLLGRS